MAANQPESQSHQYHCFYCGEIVSVVPLERVSIPKMVDTLIGTLTPDNIAEIGQRPCPQSPDGLHLIPPN